MKKTTYQKPEIRDSSGNIVQTGVFGYNSAFTNSTHDGVLDYIFNDLEALNDGVTSCYTKDETDAKIKAAIAAIADYDSTAF